MKFNCQCVQGKLIQSGMHFILLSFSFQLTLLSWMTVCSLIHPLCILPKPLRFPICVLPSPCTCTASAGGCRARASVISNGVRRSRAAQSSTGHSMAAETRTKSRKSGKTLAEKIQTLMKSCREITDLLKKKKQQSSNFEKCWLTKVVQAVWWTNLQMISLEFEF